MIIYSAVKRNFQADVDSGNIDKIILKSFKEKLHRSPGKSEISSWWNSLNFMSSVINDKNIPEDAGIAIECQIP